MDQPGSHPHPSREADVQDLVFCRKLCIPYELAIAYIDMILTWSRCTGSSRVPVSVHTLQAHRYWHTVGHLISQPAYGYRWCRADIAGLTAQQAMACVVIGAMITGMLSVLSGGSQLRQIVPDYNC